MDKVYIAAMYSRMIDMRIIATYLSDQGYTVTSRWLKEDPTNDNFTKKEDAFWRYTAEKDIQDINESDVFLLFTEPPTFPHVRGGRHVETGYALGIGMPVCIVGPKENIFHYIPEVVQFNSVHEFVATDREMKRCIMGL